MAGMRIRFTKAEATGNDFVIIADPEGELQLTAGDVRRLCDRRFGVGADGVIIATRTEFASEVHQLFTARPDATWFMDYRNADGSIAEMCGNGVRAYCQFLVESGDLIPPTASTLAIATRAGVRDVERIAPGHFELSLGFTRPSAGAEGPIVAADGLDVPRPGLPVNVGNPHVVVALSSVEELEQLDLHRAPRLDPAPVDGANVEFVVPGDPLIVDGIGRIRMRVHERGVGETLSCGTGAVASALAVHTWAGNRAPNTYRVQVPGGEVTVTIPKGPGSQSARLAGPATLVYTGEIDL